jgi:hypothetical protein
MVEKIIDVVEINRDLSKHTLAWKGEYLKHLLSGRIKINVAGHEAGRWGPLCHKTQ